jgi:small subunit ribosomal protein S2
MQKNTKEIPNMEAMLKAGAHFGYSRTRRHPSVKKSLLGSKNHSDVIDLEKTGEMLETACAFVRELGKQGKQIIFVGSKPEARDIVKEAAQSIDMPFVTERWIGGTLTNLSEIRKRVDRLLQINDEKEKGTIARYTKKERLIIDLELGRLNRYFFGLISLKNMPGAMFVVDSRKEAIAIAEARVVKVPVVSISNSDCDVSKITYPVVGNDASTSSIKLFVESIVNAYQEGALLREVVK